MSNYSTKQRELLISFLKKHPDEFFSASSLLENLENISKSAIYRNLTLLEEEKKIRRVEIKNEREKFYQFIEHDDCVGKLHLHCDKCDQIFHMTTPLTKHILLDIEENIDFYVNERETIVHGVCKKCNI
ncbi:MAG: transcriptional repressor [Clostridia bacterium]